jgi:hypothetical protein
MAVFLLAGAGAMAQYNNVQLQPNQDNTLYQDVTGSISNGSGQHLFAGSTNTGEIRRGLIQFDMNQIPSGATITHVELTMFCSQSSAGAGPQTFTLRRVSAPWGEGSSDAPGNEGSGTAATVGDATWTCSVHNGVGGCMFSWVSAGGDFTSTVSSSQVVDAENMSYTWPSTSQFVADVQDMLDNPGNNFGWVIVGNESATQTTKRFDSQENPTSENRPVLRVYFTMNAFGCSIVDQTITANPANIVCEGMGMVDMATSENGVRYWLWDPATMNLIGNAQNGNGGPLSFPTPNMTSTANYGIYAEKTLASGGLDFDGLDDGVVIGNSLNALLNGINTFTVEAWVNPSTSTGLGVIVGNYSNPVGQMQFLLRRDNSSYTFLIDAGAGFTAAISPTGAVTVGTWQHVAGTWDGNTIRLYIDGVEVTSATIVGAGMAASTNDIVIGRNNIAENFAGKIDEVRIWSSTRTQQDISQGRFWCLGGDPSLIAYYQMNEGSGTIANDNSGNGLNGTLINMDPFTDWVSGSNACGPQCSMFMTNQATFTVVPISDEDLTAGTTSICTAPGSTTIETASSLNGVNYVLRDNATDAVVDGPLAGNGSALTFNTGTMSSTTSYNVFAQKANPSSGVELLGTANTGIFPEGNVTTYTAFTAETWFKQSTPISYTSNAPVFLVCNEVAGNPNAAMAIYMDQGSGVPYIQEYNINPFPVPGSTSAPAPSSLYDGNWHHLALVGNAALGQYELYVDGVLGTTLSLPVTTWNGSVMAGFDVATFSGLTTGTYDDLRMWDFARSGSQIMADMNGCLTGTESGLLGYWRADEGTDRVLANSVAGSPLMDLGIGQSTPTPGVDYNWVAGNTACVICEMEMTEVITVTIGDSEAPMAMCQNVTVQLDASGNATLAASAVDNGTTDNCDPAPSLSLDITSFDCSNLPAPPAVKLVITGVADGPLSGGTPKFVELYALANISDLSEYGVSSANNGAGTTVTPEFTFPPVSVTAGTFIYVASEAPNFLAYMGFAADYVNAAANINGDDAIELYHNGSVVDVFGEVNVDGTGQPWEYQDGWTTRVSGTGPDGNVFQLANWTFSGINTTDGCLTNATCGSGQPVGAYTWTPSGATTVTLTATDANSNVGTCTASVFVQDNLAPVITAMPANMMVAPNNTGCTALVTWTAPTVTDNCTFVLTSTHNGGDAFPIGTTTVTYTAEDIAGNIATSSFDITVTGDLTANAAATDALCAGAMSTVDLTVSGGTAPYSYSWDNGATTEDLMEVAGNYNVVVTDANGCMAMASATITEPAMLMLTTDLMQNPTSCGVTDGAISITVTGGTVATDYTYNWNGGAFTTQDLTGLGGGVYSLVVTDDNGCMVEPSFSLSDPSAPTVAINIGLSTLVLDCFNGSNGAIELDVTLNGSATTATYTWSNGATTEDLTGLVAGSYSVTVVDDNGCTSGLAATVSEPSAIMISGMAMDASCFGFSDGMVNITATGGTVAGAYTYSWNFGAFTTEDLTGVPANTYNVAVTDDNGCTNSAGFTVNEPAEVAGNAVATDVNCNGGTAGSINLTVTVGVAPYSFLWDDASSSTTEDISGLGAATYTVTITDADGCSGTASATVGEPSALAASATSTDVMVSSDGTINLLVSGGTTPYTFAWTGPSGFTSTSEDLSGLVAGGYNVTVTDANGCTTTAAVTVGSQVGVSSADVLSLSVYPNPSNGSFVISSNSNSGQIIIRDALGREVKSMNITSNRTDVRMDGCDSGVYFVELRNNAASRTVRVVLQK